MEWSKLLDMLDEIDKWLDESSDEHDPQQAYDDLYDKYYCLGCEVGVSAQRLALAVRDYLQHRAV